MYIDKSIDLWTSIVCNKCLEMSRSVTMRCWCIHVKFKKFKYRLIYLLWYDGNHGIILLFIITIYIITVDNAVLCRALKQIVGSGLGVYPPVIKTKAMVTCNVPGPVVKLLYRCVPTYNPILIIGTIHIWNILYLSQQRKEHEKYYVGTRDFFFHYKMIKRLWRFS